MGDLLDLKLDEDIRILNLEAAPTLSINLNTNKFIKYHVNLNNLPGLFSQFTQPYVLSLANNHSLDMGSFALLQETLPYVNNIVGVGQTPEEAYYPFILGDIAVFAFGAGCAGVPPNWASNLAYLPPIINSNNVSIAFDTIRAAIDKFQPYKYTIISIHWGPNESRHNDGQIHRVDLARRLTDELNITLIYGHSSHHMRGLELYKERLIIYGAGDFVNDYENIPANYDRTGALFILDYDDITLQDLQVIPFEMKHLQCIRITDPQRIQL